MVITNTRFVWGLSAPVATMAGQIEAESSWDTTARSVYASGLAQFTPSTADWISRRFPETLSLNNPLEPQWAIRALAIYDKYLYDRQSTASDACNQWGFTLSAYNGGEGNLNRDKTLTKQSGGDTNRWFGSVERYSSRSPSAMTENRLYPSKILSHLQYKYALWGPLTPCSL
jgi:soluble lytic murein transglycosylase-like protein